MTPLVVALELSKLIMLAAVEVGQGDFLDFHHHYLAVGAARGYRPLPPEDADSP